MIYFTNEASLKKYFFYLFNEIILHTEEKGKNFEGLNDEGRVADYRFLWL